ncbi:MAG: hypothetical protein JWM56_729 [Candidatus Peribacteria bacterium]|nr:hypothetical protein [Candidatus Peribacteria bacterium]
MLTIIIVFITTFVGTLFSSMAGGGSSVLILPIFLSLGLSFPQASVIMKVGGVFGAPPAAYNYLKNRSIDWKFLLLFTGIGLFGAYLGVLAITEINERLLKVFVGILILLVVAYISFQKELGLKEKLTISIKHRIAAYPFALLLGFYESILGSANGILFAIVSMKTRGFDFIDALGHYYIIAFFWTLFAAVLLFKYGIHDIPLMVSGIVGSIAGNYIGSAFAKGKGNKFIKTMFAIVGMVLGLKLMFNL